MSAPSGTTSSLASQREDDTQPSPKRRKNSAAQSHENGYNTLTNEQTANSLATTTQPTTTTPHLPLDIDNGRPVSSSSSSATSTAKSTSISEKESSTELAQISISETASINGAVQTDGNVNEENTISKSTNSGETMNTLDQSLKRNQFGELSDGHMSLNDWLEQWRKGKTRFTMKVPNRMLVKHVDRLVEGKTKPSFFLPCCGKSLDIKWLADRGYTVVGVEIAELACRQFFEGHDLEYEEEDIKDGPQGKLFKGVDCDVRIYACDFFSVTSDLIGQFDCIWDRGSYAAMNPGDRQRYSDVISKFLKPDGRYLLDCFELEHSVFAGPPHNTDPSELERLFDGFSVEQLEHVDAMNDWTRSWGVKYFYQNDFLITHKTK